VFKLLNFIIEIRDAIILAICILVSFLLILISDQDPGAPFRSIALNTVGSVGGQLYKIGSYFRLQEQITELRRENSALAYKNAQLEDALLENIRLRKLLEFKQKSKLHLIAAEVIGQNPHGIVNGLILNEGTKRGIEESDAVLTAEGLVGKIAQVDSDHSICQILLDRNSRISAKIQRTRELGVIAWDGGTQLKMLYLANTIDVKIGDIIITSGYSQIFPENIKIGVVIDVVRDIKDLFQEVTVQPSVDFNQLEEVHIVKMIKGKTDAS
jgi:rod shape-determining protein MreC